MNSDLFNKWAEEFNLRATLSSYLIIKGKDLPKEQKDMLLTLIKSNLYEDLILAKEIMHKLAILDI